MTTHIRDRKQLRQQSIDRLISVYDLAVKHGYASHVARALAVGALERYHAGGRNDFAKKVRAIVRRKAQVGTHQASTYDRLVTGRKLENKLDLRLKGTHWEPVCDCDEGWVD